MSNGVETVIWPDGTKVMHVRAPKPVARIGPSVRRVSWRLAPDALETVRASLKTGRELGGTFVPDPVAGCLRIDQTAKLGGGNHVKIPHGLFEWHTHPLGCGMKECSLASPSSTDVDVMLKDATTDNLAHFVFTSQGCFVVRLTPGLVARIRDGSQTDVARSIVKKFEALQEEFGVRYDATRTSKDRDAVERWHETRWRVLAKRVGLDAAFYRLPAQPVVTVVTSTGPAAA
eukprot:jgi/Mesvir1/16044/Mv08340-RA.1